MLFKKRPTATSIEFISYIKREIQWIFSSFEIRATLHTLSDSDFRGLSFNSTLSQEEIYSTEVVLLLFMNSNSPFWAFFPPYVLRFFGGKWMHVFLLFLPCFSPLLLCNYRLRRSGPSPSSGKRNRKLRIPRYVAWHNVFSRIKWREKLRPYCFFVSSFCTSLDGQWRVNDWGGIFFTEIRFLGFRIGTKKVLFPLSCLGDDFWAEYLWFWDNRTLRFISLPISPTPCFPNHILAIHNYEFYLKI